MKITDVSFTRAIPAKRLEILKWLLTGGRFGKLFIAETIPCRKYWAEPASRTNFNCRSVLVPLVKDDKS